MPIFQIKKLWACDGSLLIAVSVAIFLVSPYLLIMRLIDAHVAWNFEEFSWAFKNSIVQSALSAIASVFFGFVAALALISWTRQSWKRRILEAIFVLPGFLPPVFLIIALFSLSNAYPLGIIGIIIAHTVSCFGLIASMLAKQIEFKLMRYSEIASVLGSGRWLFLIRVALPALRIDLVRAFLLVFLISLGSFSIPLVMGGGIATTLEILIYEKIRNSGNWGQAISYSFAQSAIILLVVWSRYMVIGRNELEPKLERTAVAADRHGHMQLLRSPYLALVASVGMSYLILYYLQSVFSGFARWTLFTTMLSNSLGPILMSCFFSVAVGLALILAFLAILYCLPMQALEKFLSGYLAPSTALSSFAFLTIGADSQFLRSLLAIAVLVLVYLAAVFRLGINSRFRDLIYQIQLAETLGAGRTLIYRKIVLPQMLGAVIFSAGIGAVWASGDFAVTRLFTSGDSTLGLIVQSLAASYRLELAGAMSVVLLAIGAGIFLLFLGASYVVDKKSQA